ncbi:MAG: acetyl-CoA carboxylase, carboxyltransferase subunit beta [Brevinema sp.]
MGWFTKKSQTDNVWYKCPECHFSSDMTEYVNSAKRVCEKCGYHERMLSAERVDLLCDEGSFIEINEDVTSVDFLGFFDGNSYYATKLKESRQKSELNDAVITGRAKINNHPVIIAIMDFSFMGGSMGSVVGEKITRAIEEATKKRLPFIVVCASGGARMQEGVVSLMQMAKTSAAVKRHSDAGGLYITVLTNPTTGGVSASFAMLGDFILAEPKALIGFAGPRVIESTIKQKLPAGFQRAEFQKDHGFVDMVVHRHDLKTTLSRLIAYVQ